MINKPALDEHYEQIREDITSSLGITRKFRFSVIDVLSRVLAAVAFSLYSYIDVLAKNLLPDSASKVILERWCAIWGIFRKPASFSTGLAKFTGVAESVIPVGTRLQDESGLIFSTSEAGTINSSGDASVQIRSEQAGLSSNIESGTTLNLINPVPGLVSSAEVAENLTGGSDIENDTSLRGRLLDRIRKPPQGGAAHDYIAWAKEIPGITRAWVFPLYRKGAGQVGVTFVLDNESNIIPSEVSEKFKEVDSYIKSKAPITAVVSTFSPIPKVIDITINLTPSTDEVKTQVTQEILDLFFRESDVGGAFEANGTILISKIREAISTAEGEEDHTLISPTDNISVGIGEIAILGTITWQENIISPS